MTSPDLEHRLAIAHQLADQAGNILRQYFRRPHLASQTKTDQISAIVTLADQAAEDAMVQILRQHLPDDGIIREEGDNIPPQSGYTWVLDPLDGTSSFVRGLPIFGTLIGLVNDQMTPVLGIADQPITGDRWQGVQGEPSRLNGALLVNPYADQETSLQEACLVSTTPLMFTTPTQKAQVEKLYTHCQRTAFGGDCLNYLALAAGWTAMPLVILEADMNFYDFCALIPILNGVGIPITDWQGHTLLPDSSEIVVASNPFLHQRILQALWDGDRAD
jgi:histidinol phosphatase-like enzyme (inositol monophosphatase family)